MKVNISTTIPLSASVGRRFYEPAILLYCLILVNFKKNNTQEPDLETGTGKSSKDEFFCFVNKLGQICDNERGGDTITAFAVLQPGSTQYRFASNNRNLASLEKVKKYITDILTGLGKTPESRLDEVHPKILREVLKFNRPRIEIYTNIANQQFDFCIGVCEREENDETRTAEKNLKKLQNLVNHIATSEDYNTNSLALITAINALYSTPFQDFLRTKSRLDQDPSNRTPWSELRHALGRLQSYYIAVSVLISVRRRRPQLFEDFEVVYVPSVGPPPKTPNVRRSAEGMVQRMGAEIIQAYRYHAAYLESIGLDKAIQRAVDRLEFQPCVHCEVNLLDSVLNDAEGRYYSASDDGEPIRFYEEATFGRYIGCSKPTCRFCGMYFAAHPAEVKVRSSHLNVYYKWRVPDVYEHQGEMARIKRDEILESMIKGVRNVILQTIGVGNGGAGGGGVLAPVRRAHDSFTDPSNPYPLRGGSNGFSVKGSGVVPGENRLKEVEEDVEERGAVVGDQQDIGDLADRLGGLGI